MQSELCAGADIKSDILLGLSFGVEVRSDVGNRRECNNGKETVSSQIVGRRSFEQAFVSFELLWLLLLLLLLIL